MLVHFLSVLGFMLVSFAVQGLSHFVINKDHFASITFMRLDPIIPMGLLAMVIQGAILSLAMSRISTSQASLANGMAVSLAFGLFLAVYIVVVEPSKYTLPSITAWVTVEGIASTVQFVVFGFVLAAIHQRFG